MLKWIVKCSVCGKEFTREAPAPPIGVLARNHMMAGKIPGVVTCPGSDRPTVFVRAVKSR